MGNKQPITLEEGMRRANKRRANRMLCCKHPEEELIVDGTWDEQWQVTKQVSGDVFHHQVFKSPKMGDVIDFIKSQGKKYTYRYLWAGM